jgi:hypothetical protein
MYWFEIDLPVAFKSMSKKISGLFKEKITPLTGQN